MIRMVMTFLLLFAAISMAANNDDIAEKRRQADEQYDAGEKSYTKRQLTKAMNHYLTGLRISEENNLNEESCKIYIGIGNLYSSQADYEMGIRFYRKALNMAKKEDNRTLQNKALNNLVGASCFANKPTEGKHYYDMLAANKESSAEYRYNLLMCKGIISANENNTATAISCYKRAIDYANSHQLVGGHKESARSCLAQLYDNINEADSALHYLRQNEGKARASGQNDLLMETLRQEASIYQKTGNKQQALACKEEYVGLADSLYNVEEFNSMKNAQYLYEASKSEKAISSLTEEKRQQRLWLLTLAIGSTAFAIMLIIVYRQKHQLTQAYNELFDRNQALLTPPPVGSQSLLSDEQRTTLLERIRHIMEETDEFCNCDFNIDKLASLIGSNSRYVSSVINDSYGKNFRTFLNEYRIKEAMKRLSDTERYGNYTIRAVSESVGYKSQANFITVFTKVTGMKPSIYQKISLERKS